MISTRSGKRWTSYVRRESPPWGSLDAYLDEVSGKVVSIRSDVRKTERRIKAIDAALSHIRNHDAHRAVYKEYASIGWKKKKEKFADAHREELDAYLAAVRYFKAHEKEQPFDRKKLDAERRALSGELPVRNEELKMVQADVQVLRDVRNWINHVLPSEQRRATAEPGRKPSVREDLNWKAGALPGRRNRDKRSGRTRRPAQGKNRIWNIRQRLSCGAYRRRELFLFQEEPIECI